MIKGVIFDADGTLLNSMEFWDSTVVDLIKSTGVTPEEGLTEILTPMSMEEGAAYIKKEYGLPFSVEEIIEEENRIIEDFYFNRVQMRGGTVELLELLKSNNIPIAIATATDRYLIEGALKHLGIYDYFTAVLSCSEIGEGKTSPKIYLTACELMGTLPNETAVAEDSLPALTTAKNAGFRAISVYDTTQKRYWESLKQLGELTVEGSFNAADFSFLIREDTVNDLIICPFL